MTNDWARKDENGKPIIDMDGHIFNVLSKEEQQNPKNTLYLWLHRYDGEWNLKFGATHKTIWDRYSDAGTIHLQQIYCWESELWDKDFEDLLHKKFNWKGQKESNDMYSEEAYKVKDANEVEEFIKCISYHVHTNGKELSADLFKEFQNRHFKEHFSSRSEQEDFINRFIEFYKSPNRQTRRFLLYAVCRFGKTATTLYTMIKHLNLKKILILSSKCDTNDSWKTDFLKWDFCKNYIYLDKYAIQKNPELLQNNNIITWCSFQSAAKDFETFDENGEVIETDEIEENWQKIVADTKWDIVITDECHFGVDTKRSSALINRIMENEETFLLEISATPFKKINRGDYTSNNIYAYTLIDEWNEHHNDIEGYVPVNLYHLNLMKYLTEHNHSKSPANKKLLQNKIENCIVDDKFSWRAYYTQFDETDIRTEFNLLYDKFYKHTGPHCLIYVNRVKDGNKIARALSVNDELHNYEIINVCGNNKISKTDIDNKMKCSKPVIIVSCGKFMTGVTLKLLTNVIFMGKVNSAEMYIQYGLRAKNKYKGRKYPCAIYDLNTSAYVYSDPFKIMVHTEARSKNTSIVDIVRNYEDAMAIFELNECDVFEKFENFASKFTETFAHIDGDEEIPFCSFEMNEDIMNKLQNLLTNKIDKQKIRLEITPDQIAPANEIKENIKKKKGRKPLSAEEKNKLKKIYELRNKFREQVKYIPTFMKFNNIENVDDIFTEENTNLLKIWHNINVEVFKTLREILSVNDWIEMCENIKAIKNKLPDDDMSWKYRGELPAWF